MYMTTWYVHVYTCGCTCITHVYVGFNRVKYGYCTGHCVMLCVCTHSESVHVCPPHGSAREARKDRQCRHWSPVVPLLLTSLNYTCTCICIVHIYMYIYIRVCNHEHCHCRWVWGVMTVGWESVTMVRCALIGSITAEEKPIADHMSWQRTRYTHVRVHVQYTLYMYVQVHTRYMYMYMVTITDIRVY